ncbi:predicted protein [Streptomyces viridochromogenes DSM 40736]|uniref:Predicted protein n=1 Tax=Streptomyces viridochromogenes (strain DSM 40736 / JCM 4977 / BCRC 1201 / Tue 494) TaxID=591159 RepID=D9XAC4_STRVT|nr:hypothetical protein [Streptomyces viridochromogenes]EFL36514.1 predicted protein [Streptomyces viridochromogenes DSM 40736]
MLDEVDADLRDALARLGERTDTPSAQLVADAVHVLAEQATLAPINWPSPSRAAWHQPMLASGSTGVGCGSPGRLCKRHPLMGESDLVLPAHGPLQRSHPAADHLSCRARLPGLQTPR